VFGFERISVHENFFDAGGHSLLATQVISRIHDIFLITLPMKVIFQAPTVAGLAEALVQYEAFPGQVVKIARLYTQVNAMSDDEASAVLQQRKDEGK
jgi:acyl carrier protein